MRFTSLELFLLIIAGLFLVWQDARSESDYILHGGSVHFGGEYDYNETNSGFGYRYYLMDGFAIGGGVYDNSFNRTSYYGGFAAFTPVGRHVDLGLQVGIVSGYAGTPQGTGTVTPYVLPTVRVRWRRLFADVGVLPVGDIPFITYSVGLTW